MLSCFSSSELEKIAEGLTSSAKTKNPNYRLNANGILKLPRKRQIGTLRNNDCDGKGNSKKQ